MQPLPAVNQSTCIFCIFCSFPDTADSDPWRSGNNSLAQDAQSSVLQEALGWQGMVFQKLPV